MSHDDEVQPWTGVRTFHPEMRLETPAPSPQVLEALASGVVAEGFSIKQSDPAGFTAQLTEWLALLGGTFNRTELLVSWTDEQTVLVRVEGHGDRNAKKAARGLSRGVRALREQGVAVVVQPWVVPEGRRKGKRR